jgi:hypothetical protein
MDSGFGRAHGALHPRVRRVLERVYAIDGVAEARAWLWPGHMAVAVNGVGAEAQLLRRVAAACQGLEEPNEEWSFGILGD